MGEPMDESSSSSLRHRLSGEKRPRRVRSREFLKRVPSRGKLVKRKTQPRAEGRKWTAVEDAKLRKAVKRYKGKAWRLIAEAVPNRSDVQCLQRWKKVLAPGLKKGRWTAEEDAALRKRVAKGYKNWGEVAEDIPGRSFKQCRERWTHRLQPSRSLDKKVPWTPEEDTLLIAGREQFGSNFTAIARMLPGRIENNVRMRWATLRRRRSREAARASGPGRHGHGKGTAKGTAKGKHKGKGKGVIRRSSSMLDVRPSAARRSLRRVGSMPPKKKKKKKGQGKHDQRRELEGYAQGVVAHWAAHQRPRSNSEWGREFRRRAEARYKGRERVQHANGWVGTGARRARPGDVPAWLRSESEAAMGGGR